MWTRLNRQLTTESIASGSKTFQAVAQLDGWQFALKNQPLQVEGAFLRVVPKAVRVQENGAEQRVLWADPVIQIERMLGLIGLSVTIVCWLTLWLTLWLTRNLSRRRQRNPREIR